MKRQAFLILTPGFPKDENDTTCIPSVQSFVKNLSHQYPELHIIVAATDYPFEKGNYEWKGIKVISLAHKNSRGAKRYMQLGVAFFCLKKALKAYDVIGILSMWGSYSALLGHLLGKIYGVKHYCWLRGQEVRKGNRVMRFFKNKKHELLVISKEMNEKLQKNYGFCASRVIPMAVDTEAFEKINSRERDIDIIGVGSLIPLKQWNVFVDVISNVVELYPNVQCILSGDGSERTKIEQLVTAKGLTNNIHFTGEISHNEVLQLMSRSKILLHPASYEGYAAVFTEALYAGCHCISFVNPEQKKVDHWHIAKNENQMISITQKVLQFPEDSFFSIKQYDMAQCVKDIMQLYNFRKADSISSAIAAKDSLEV